MLERSGAAWRIYIRPFALAAIFTVVGETMMFVLWGMVLYSEGDVLARLLWAVVDAFAMSAVIGLMVGFIVGGRYNGAVAGVISSFCYATVLVAGILICFELDIVLGLFGIRNNPKLYIITVLLATLLSTPLYGWLLHSDKGKALFSRIGL